MGRKRPSSSVAGPSCVRSVGRQSPCQKSCVVIVKGAAVAPRARCVTGELSVVVQVEQDGQRRQLIVAGGQLHDDAVGLHAALPDALPEAVAVCAERLAAVGVVGQQRFGRFEDGVNASGLPSAPAAKIPVTAAPALERRTSRPPAQRSV